MVIDLEKSPWIESCAIFAGIFHKVFVKNVIFTDHYSLKITQLFNDYV